MKEWGWENNEGTGLGEQGRNGAEKTKKERGWENKEGTGLREQWRNRTERTVKERDWENNKGTEQREQWRNGAERTVKEQDWETKKDLVPLGNKMRIHTSGIITVGLIPYFKVEMDRAEEAARRKEGAHQGDGGVDGDGPHIVHWDPLHAHPEVYHVPSAEGERIKIETIS